MYRQGLIAGSLFAALAVGLGAFGAHALKSVVQESQLLVYETGVRYQFYHSFALLFSGVVYGSFPHKNLKRAAFFFVTGILLFSGSLYAMTLLSASGGNYKAIGILTPFGGLSFIAGWILFLTGVAAKKVNV